MAADVCSARIVQVKCPEPALVGEVTEGPFGFALPEPDIRRQVLPRERSFLYLDARNGPKARASRLETFREDMGSKYDPTRG